LAIFDSDEEYPMRILKRFALLCLLLAVAGCGRSTAYWTEQLKSPDSPTRLHAVYALRARVKEPAAVVPALVEALMDDDTFIRRDAARALGRFGPKAQEAVPSLHHLLGDRN
jgi:HEAT repeat protein